MYKYLKNIKRVDLNSFPEFKVQFTKNKILNKSFKKFSIFDSLKKNIVILKFYFFLIKKNKNKRFFDFKSNTGSLQSFIAKKTKLFFSVKNYSKSEIFRREKRKAKQFFSFVSLFFFILWKRRKNEWKTMKQINKKIQRKGAKKHVNRTNKEWSYLAHGFNFSAFFLLFFYGKNCKFEKANNKKPQQIFSNLKKLKKIELNNPNNEQQKKNIYILEFLKRNSIEFLFKNLISIKNKKDLKHFYKYDENIFYFFNNFIKKIKNNQKNKNRIKNIKFFCLKKKEFVSFLCLKNIWFYINIVINFYFFSLKKIQLITIMTIFSTGKNKKNIKFFIKSFFLSINYKKIIKNNDLFYLFNNKNYLNNLLFEINNIVFFLNNYFSIFRNLKYKNLIMKSFYKNNLRTFLNFFLKNKKFKFFLNIQIIFYCIEMTYFLSKKNFYNKRKKFLFVKIQKILWNLFIFKKKSFLTLYSIIFPNKLNSIYKTTKKRYKLSNFGLKKKKKLFLNLEKIKIPLILLYYASSVPSFFLYAFLLNNKATMNNIRKRKIEIILGPLKFAFSFELYFNILSYYFFNGFIKQSIKKIKNNFILYDCLNFYKKKFLNLKNFASKKLLISNNGFYILLVNKQNLVINNPNFLYILKKLIETLKQTKSFKYILHFKKSFCFLKKNLKNFLSFFKLLLKVFYPFFLELNSKKKMMNFGIENYLNPKMGFLSQSENNSERKQLKKIDMSFFLKKKIHIHYYIENIGFYYGSFLLNFNINIINIVDFFYKYFVKSFLNFKISKFFTIKSVKSNLKKNKKDFNTYIIKLLKYKIFKSVLEKLFLNKRFKKKDFIDPFFSFVQKNRKKSEIENCSIFFTYKKNFKNQNKFLFDFKKFFLNFSFFTIYKNFQKRKILSLFFLKKSIIKNNKFRQKNSTKFFLIKKWDPLKKRIFQKKFNDIWKKNKISFYENYYNIFSNSKFSNFFILDKNNLFILNSTNIMSNKFSFAIFLWNKKISNKKKDFLFKLKKVLSLEKTYSIKKNGLNVKGFFLFFANPSTIKDEKNQFCFKRYIVHSFSLFSFINSSAFLKLPIVKRKTDNNRNKKLRLTKDSFFLQQLFLLKNNKVQNFYFYVLSFNKDKQILSLNSFQSALPSRNIEVKMEWFTSFLPLLFASQNRFCETNVKKLTNKTNESRKGKSAAAKYTKKNVNGRIENLNRNLNFFGLIPSKIFLKNHLVLLKKIIFKYNSQTQKKLLYKLSLHIVNCCYYYRIVTNSQIFYFCDKIIYKFLWKWACRNHPNKSKKWIQKKYFFSLKNKKWVFGLFPKNFDSELSIKTIFYLPFHHFLIQI